MKPYVCVCTYIYVCCQPTTYRNGMYLTTAAQLKRSEAVLEKENGTVRKYMSTQKLAHKCYQQHHS